MAALARIGLVLLATGLAACGPGEVADAGSDAGRDAASPSDGGLPPRRPPSPDATTSR
ncbi:MAG: hypothetical protein M5U28_27455 [Sandaracinaceae bacterium]|nr:hypothetical protein [Sandaracinaceae bacterium]